MKCIYVTLFSDIKVFYLLLESIFIFGNLDSDTHIVVYTSSDFKNKIQESHLYDSNVVFFEVNDGRPSQDPKSDFFKLSCASKYEKILYLDAGILINNDIDPLFSSCEQDNLLYTTDNGKMLLFKNSLQNRDLFMNDNIINGNFQVLYRHPLLFSKCVEEKEHYLNEIKEELIAKKIEEAKQYIDANLLPIIHQCGEKLEGNIFMFHETTKYTNLFQEKVKNISNLVLNQRVTSVMEIGFNSGFSTLLMLLSNPKMKITCFDIGEHSYTVPCYNKLKETFGDRIHLIIGDSTKTVTEFARTEKTKFDLIHIDGGHEVDVATSDIENAIQLSRKNTILIMDDYDFPKLHSLWDSYIDRYGLKKLDIFVYNSRHHDVRSISK